MGGEVRLSEHVRSTAYLGGLDVGVRVSSGEVVGHVEDDGRGFLAGEEGATRGGVRSMGERAELLGGTLKVSSSGPGAGTSVRVTIPLKGGLDNRT